MRLPRFASVLLFLLPPALLHAQGLIDAHTHLGGESQDNRLQGTVDRFRLGTLEPGKAADVIAVPGNPLTEIKVMEKVKFVM